MSDLTNWKVHGPVETLKTENATWDINLKDWQFFPYFTVASFRPDGAVSTRDAHNPGGSVQHSRWLYNSAGLPIELDSWTNDGPVSQTIYIYDASGRPIRTEYVGSEGKRSDVETCTYDAAGRKTKVRFLPHTEVDTTCEAGKACGASTMYGIEGTDASYGAPGATTMTTIYDEKELPSEVVFHDANHNVVGHVIFTRDSAGSLLKEEMHFGETSSFFQGIVDKSPPERREAMAAMLKAVIGDRFSAVSYKYDNSGHMIERTITMGNLDGDRTTYRYGDHDDPIEETTEHRSRGADLGENGSVQYSPDRVNVQHNRLEYRYDAHGNWTERIVSIQSESDTDFQRSNMECRTITYYAG
jgi:YD repeat-containing protein